MKGFGKRIITFCANNVHLQNAYSPIDVAEAILNKFPSSDEDAFLMELSCCTKEISAGGLPNLSVIEALEDRDLP
ncbi:hypothetical protein M9Y10_010332 [Tritrichomonas musculus]|uniref:Uncharacterized protein n=1 Tax=Tritrichomonas musculus TaxID=1915356 RepID=A0ABR2IKK7_9EUKA